jgi:Enoyl-(Acyl carrier protein) reductase
VAGARAAVVLGARNLGGAIVDNLVAGGWSDRRGRSQRGDARGRSTAWRAGARGRRRRLARARCGARTRARRARPDRPRGERRQCQPPPGGGPFGGGPLAEASVEAFRGWTAAVAEQAFVFLSSGARALRESGGGALVQVTGGSSRRVMPGRGRWAAGAFATRALLQAAAQELRAEGIHVALLVVDATIESPRTAAYARDTPRDALASQEEIARAVAYLAGQDARAMTHELVLTPAGDRWVP